MTKRRRFTDEFKQGAVKLVQEQGYSCAEAARSLGIHENRVSSWCRKAAAQAAAGSGAVSSETVQEELSRLRDENRRLLMEREILKKAAVFFANEKK
jgi:transposase